MRRNSRYHHNSAGPIHGQERGRGVRLAPRTLTAFRLEEVLEIHAKILQMCDGTALGKLLNFINSNQPFSNLPLAAKRVKLFLGKYAGRQGRPRPTNYPDSGPTQPVSAQLPHTRRK